MHLSFACEPDATDALNRFLKDQKNDFYPLTGSVGNIQEKVKRKKTGRPGKDEITECNNLCKIRLQAGELEDEAYTREKEHLSCFVLISNIFHAYSAAELLKEYKQQSVVENRFKFVKHPLYVGPLWLQKNERLEAMSYLILMALAVFIILQRRVRLALQKEDVPLRLKLCKPVKIVYIKEDGTVKRFLPERYLELSRAISMIGFEMEIFTKPRAPEVHPITIAGKNGNSL